MNKVHYIQFENTTKSCYRSRIIYEGVEINLHYNCTRDGSYQPSPA
jgi:hypothetical protein